MKKQIMKKSESLKEKKILIKILSKYKQYNAFTLAEVLIVLMIIGVVAALSMPMLISKIDDIITRNLFLKQVTLLEQASKEYLADNGGSFLDQFDGRQNGVAKFLAKYYKTNKVCTRTTEYACLNLTALPLNSTDPTKAYIWDTGIISADGTYVMVSNAHLNCDLTGACLQGAFDINGPKGPNRVGYDTFLWYLSPEKLFFTYGAFGSDRSKACIKEPNTNWDAWYNNGEGCAMRMLQGLPKWQ